MKNSKQIILLIAVVFLAITSCTSDDDNSDTTSNDAQIAQVETTVEDGTWRITNFVDSGQNETSDFTGYAFTFATDGTLIASNNANTIEGTWSITDDSGSSDDSSSDDDIDFNIFFPVSDSSDFEDLNDDWDIVTTSATKIELIDVSGGNGGTDLLTFEKI